MNSKRFLIFRPFARIFAISTFFLLTSFAGLASDERLDRSVGALRVVEDISYGGERIALCGGREYGLALWVDYPEALRYRAFDRTGLTRSEVAIPIRFNASWGMSPGCREVDDHFVVLYFTEDMLEAARVTPGDPSKTERFEVLSLPRDFKARQLVISNDVAFLLAYDFGDGPVSISVIDLRSFEVTSPSRESSAGVQTSLPYRGDVHAVALPDNRLMLIEEGARLGPRDDRHVYATIFDRHGNVVAHRDIVTIGPLDRTLVAAIEGGAAIAVERWANNLYRVQLITLDGLLTTVVDRLLEPHSNSFSLLQEWPRRALLRLEHDGRKSFLAIDNVSTVREVDESAHSARALARVGETTWALLEHLRASALNDNFELTGTPVALNEVVVSQTSPQMARAADSTFVSWYEPERERIVFTTFRGDRAAGPEHVLATGVSGGYGYDVASDGVRFVVAMPRVRSDEGWRSELALRSFTPEGLESGSEVVLPNRAASRLRWVGDSYITASTRIDAGASFVVTQLTRDLVPKNEVVIPVSPAEPYPTGGTPFPVDIAVGESSLAVGWNSTLGGCQITCPSVPDEAYVAIFAKDLSQQRIVRLGTTQNVRMWTLIATPAGYAAVYTDADKPYAATISPSGTVVATQLFVPVDAFPGGEGVLYGREYRLFSTFGISPAVMYLDEQFRLKYVDVLASASTRGEARFAANGQVSFTHSRVVTDAPFYGAARAFYRPASAVALPEIDLATSVRLVSSDSRSGKMTLEVSVRNIGRDPAEHITLLIAGYESSKVTRSEGWRCSDRENLCTTPSLLPGESRELQVTVRPISNSRRTMLFAHAAAVGRERNVENNRAGIDYEPDRRRPLRREY